MKVEVTDVDGTATYESLSYTVKGEAHDVVLEWTREIDFKTVRVGEARKESLKLLNKGPYEVQFQFRLPKKLQELLSISPLEGTLRGMSGFKEAAITMVDVVFRSDKEIQIGKKSADLEVVFIEPTLKELAYPPQHIQVRAEALYNKYQISLLRWSSGSGRDLMRPAVSRSRRCTDIVDFALPVRETISSNEISPSEIILIIRRLIRLSIATTLVFVE